MELKLHSLAGLSLVAGLTLLPATHASAWWACPTGYNAAIESRNNDTQVRCVRPEDTRPFDECPNATANGVTVGTGHRRNWHGSRDKCVGFIGGQPVIVLDLSCTGSGPGYTQQVLDGDDRCRRPGSEAAPTRNVN